MNCINSLRITGSFIGWISCSEAVFCCLIKPQESRVTTRWRNCTQSVGPGPVLDQGKAEFKKPKSLHEVIDV